MHQYFRVEYERRFLIPAMPQGKPSVVRRIVDRYLDGTRMRLRRMEGTGEPELKLTQKIPQPGGPLGRQGELTTFYLSEAEYQVLAALPGAELVKMRYSFPPMGVDVFAGALEGLLIAEMETETEAEIVGFAPPAWCGREITRDAAYACGTLARLNEAEARELVRTLSAG